MVRLSIVERGWLWQHWETGCLEQLARFGSDEGKDHFMAEMGREPVVIIIARVECWCGAVVHVNLTVLQ